MSLNRSIMEVPEGRRNRAWLRVYRAQDDVFQAVLLDLVSDTRTYLCESDPSWAAITWQGWYVGKRDGLRQGATDGAPFYDKRRPPELPDEGFADFHQVFQDGCLWVLLPRIDRDAASDPENAVLLNTLLESTWRRWRVPRKTFFNNLARTLVRLVRTQEFDRGQSA